MLSFSWSRVRYCYQQVKSLRASARKWGLYVKDLVAGPIMHWIFIISRISRNSCWQSSTKSKTVFFNVYTKNVCQEAFMIRNTGTRVAKVVWDSHTLLTQDRYMKLKNWYANTFLIQNTSNYFLASESKKTKVFKSLLWISPSVNWTQVKILSIFNTSFDFYYKKCQTLVIFKNFMSKNWL